MQTAMIFIGPLVALVLYVMGTLWWLHAKAARLKRFADLEGITYQRRGKAPMGVPPVLYGKRSVTAMHNFFYGSWHGSEVFACDFSVGQGRGQVEWLYMVAVKRELHDTGGWDAKRWKVMPFNGWTFLIPIKPKGGTLNIRRITELWNAMIAPGSGSLGMNDSQLKPGTRS